jgi:flagellar assembly protein FliH
LSRVIRSSKIDENYFSLIVDFVEQEEISDEPAKDEQVLIPEEIENLRAAAAEEADQIIKDARKKAKEIFSAAKQQEQKIMEQARSKGYQEGFAEGREAGIAQARAETEEETRQAQLEANKTISQAEKIRLQLLDGAEEEVVELAMTIASKVIRSHVEVKRDTVVQLAREALERAISASYYSIFVNPGDVELLREYISELRLSASGGARIHIVADSSISLGGCKVETEHGLVDMTLESQLEEIRKALREELEGNKQQMVGAAGEV